MRNLNLSQEIDPYQEEYIRRQEEQNLEDFVSDHYRNLSEYELPSSFTYGIHRPDRIKKKSIVFLYLGIPTKGQVVYFSKKGSRQKRRECWNHHFKNPQKRHCGFRHKTAKEAEMEKRILLSIMDELLLCRANLIESIRTFILSCKERVVLKNKLEKVKFQISVIDSKIQRLSPDSKFPSKKRIPASREQKKRLARVRLSSADCYQEFKEELSAEDLPEENRIGVYHVSLPDVPAKEEPDYEDYSIEEFTAEGEYDWEAHIEFKKDTRCPNIDEPEEYEEPELRLLSMKEAKILMS